MKKLSSLILLGLFSAAVQAQSAHTLTTERNAYRAADALVKQQVEFKDPGSSGRNLSWDFRFIQPINENYSLDYFIPDSTQMTHLCGMEHNTRYYYRQQHDSLQATGFENYLTYMEYTQPELRMHFPFAYGDTLFSRFEGKGQYCHRLKLAVKGYTRVEADAEGELLLANWETVKKATRIRTLRHYTETGKDSVEMTLDTYSWYAAGIRYPVFESIKTNIQRKKSNGSEMDTTVFSTSFYYPPELQTSQVATAPIPVDSVNTDLGAAGVFTEAQLMPNPVVENLNINYKLTRSAKVWFTLHNNAGIALCSTAPENLTEGIHTTTVAMGGLITGVYSLYVHVDDMAIKLNVIKK